MAQASPPQVVIGTSTSVLYSHAIESILAFCSLRELAVALTVSHQWLQAVRTMAPINGTASRRVWPIRLVAKVSPLRRHIVHIAEIEPEPVQSNEDSDDEEPRRPLPPLPVWTAMELELLAERIPRLQSLHFSLTLTHRVSPPFVFPAALRSLRIAFKVGDESFDDDPQPLGVMRSIATLPALTALDLDIGFEDWSLAALATAPALQHLTLRWVPTHAHSSDLTSENREALRRMDRLLSLQLCGSSSTAVVSLLCARGHTMLSLQRICANDSLSWWGAQDGEEEYLTNVPTLTALNMTVRSRWDRLPMFLGSLPLLCDLCIFFRDSHRDGEDVARSLHPCRSLTSLEIASAKLSSAQLASIIALNPGITRLVLSDMHVLENLAFLDSAPLRSSLQFLTLDSCVGLHIAELARVDALCALEELRLLYSFIEGVGDEVEQRYRPPCKRIPTLRLFKAMSSPI